MKLYQVEKCPYAHRARVVLEEKKLGYEVSYFAGGKRPAELEALGPGARSPTLFDGEVRVWDSLVVCEYLDERYPETPLLPRDPAGRARARILMKEVEAKFVASARPIEEELVHHPTSPNEAKIAEAMRRARESLEPWQARLDKTPFLLGSDFSMADIALFTPIVGIDRLLGARGDLLAGFPAISAWRDRVAARPSTAY
jgi:glutathione S-transferase